MENTQFSPPFTPSNPNTSFLVLALSILGILAISLLLLLYYLFIIKRCHLSWYPSRTDIISPRQNWYEYPVRHGLNESSIQAIPTIRYRKDDDRNHKIAFHECAVCINEFIEEERIRFLPDCCHVFHLDCIDTWLQNNANCPLCRAPITCSPNNALMHLVGPTSQEGANESNNHIVIDVFRNDELLCVNNFEERENYERILKSFGTSMGDECLTSRNCKEGMDLVPMRRSISMDSSIDKQLYIALQNILKSNTDSSSSSSSNNERSGKLKRGFFSFNQNRSRSVVLPI